MRRHTGVGWPVAASLTRTCTVCMARSGIRPGFNGQAGHLTEVGTISKVQSLRVEELRHERLPFDLSLANEAPEARDLSKGLIAGENTNKIAVPPGPFHAEKGPQLIQF